MNWVALVPIKAAPARKTRLSGVLSPDDRVALTATMLEHVLGRLRACSRIAVVRVLSPDALPGTVAIRDEGRGLNEEVARARIAIGPAPFVVIHADLPFLETGDVDALLTAAEASGQAIAPDRYGIGTNAVALGDGAPFAWRFGPASFDGHRARLRPGHAVVHRRGLAADCDTPDDVSEVLASGFLRELALACDGHDERPKR